MWNKNFQIFFFFFELHCKGHYAVLTFGGDNFQATQAFSKLMLGALCIPDLIMALQRAISSKLEPKPFWLRPSDIYCSNHAELKISILCPAKAGYWQSTWQKESLPLHIHSHGAIWTVASAAQLIKHQVVLRQIRTTILRETYCERWFLNLFLK
jgi:hypothetical protein